MQMKIQESPALKDVFERSGHQLTCMAFPDSRHLMCMMFPISLHDVSYFSA